MGGGVMRLLEVISPPGGSSWLTRLDARVKLGALFCASLFMVLLDSAWSLSSLCLLSFLPAAFARLGINRWLLLIVMAGSVTWGTMFSQSIFYYGEPRTVLFNLVESTTPLLGALTGEVNIYIEGFQHGAVQSLRITAMMILGMTLCWTTDNAAMLGGLLYFRLPFVLAFMAVTAVRFLPVILEEFAQVALAWRLRGGRLFSANPVRTVLFWLKITRSVLINCYRRSATLALSIQTRAFTPQAARHQVTGRPLRPAELSGLGLMVLATSGALLMKILYWLYLAGLHYHSNLRQLYEFCRFYF